MVETRLLDPKEAAGLLGCTESALALWRRQRVGPVYVRLGQRLIRYRSEDLFRWVHANQVEPGLQQKTAAPQAFRRETKTGDDTKGGEGKHGVGRQEVAF